MKKTILLFISILFSGIMICQSQLTETNKKETDRLPQLNETSKPLYVIVVDSVSHRLENIEGIDIEPEWIENIYVLKDATSKRIYGNKNGVIMIYIKPKYSSEVIALLEKDAEK